MNNLTVETEDTFASLLDFAANNDIEGFERYIECDLSGIDEVGLWYGRQKGSKQMVLEHRTPLMVAATYGSVDVVKLILSLSDVVVDVNRPHGLDRNTALHCAASGGSMNAVDVVKLLLEAGADPNMINANGHYPIDVIVVSPKFQDLKFSLEKFLTTNDSVSTATSNSNSPPQSPSLSSSSNSNSSPNSSKFINVTLSEKKEYPIDPSMPDIKNTIYSTDEFRMFSFKVRPCSRAYSHDWTDCPFVHPGENARRRDPRKYHYSCVPCPDFRKGACRLGDMCEYAHGVFESWLHPAQYRTRLCKDGTSCNRRVCFFAHTQQELRPLYVSTGSAIMSPSPFTPPLSPSTNGISNMGWPHPNVPALNLPGSNNHQSSSRLRSSLNARDFASEDLDLLPDFDVQQQQLLQNELCRFSQLGISNNSLNCSAESSSPRFSDQALASSVFSPTHKSAIFNQFQHQTISPMSPRVSLLAQHEKQKQQFRSRSFRDLGSNSASDSWSKWGSSNGKPDWSVNPDECGRLRRSSSFELGNNGDEPDLSWVQSLVKESPQEVADAAGFLSEGSNLNSQIEANDQSVLGDWMEQMQLDQLMAW
ncbi:hypothetical protein CsSME_00039508 [Camellia sinensis var. sinensis]